MQSRNRTLSGSETRNRFKQVPTAQNMFEASLIDMERVQATMLRGRNRVKIRS
jgi:hypothetical protein